MGARLAVRAIGGGGKGRSGYRRGKTTKEDNKGRWKKTGIEHCGVLGFGRRFSVEGAKYEALG